MKSTNNYHPRPPMGDLVSTIFWALVACSIIAKCIEKISELW